VKLNWFSPVPPTPSGIAIHTSVVVPELAKHVSVTIWAHEDSWPAELEEHAAVRRYDPSSPPWADINAADATIYHLGNHPEFHRPIWQISRQHPGVVVLHDVGLQHFFAGLVGRNPGLSEVEYREMMAFHHPRGGAELADAFLLGLRSAEDICNHCPLTGAALENATGVIVHTHAAYSELVRQLDLPIAYVPLFALSGKHRAPGSEISQKADGDPYRIIMFGFLNANRRLSSVLRALRDFPEKRRFRLDVYGTLEDERSTRQLIEAFGLAGTVTIHGFVPSDELEEALLGSDLAVNLRDPTVGEASGSQLIIWQYGLPSLVTNIGWYGTLPKNTVAAVRREAELQDIQSHLAAFLQNPEHYRELGRNGRLYAQEHHTMEAHVQGVLDLVEQTLRGSARHAASWMSGRIGRAIRPWFGEDAAGLLLANPADAIHDLVNYSRGPSPRSGARPNRR